VNRQPVAGVVVDVALTVVMFAGAAVANAFDLRRRWQR